MNFNVYFNIFLSKCKERPLVKMKETLIHIYSFSTWQGTESRSYKCSNKRLLLKTRSLRVTHPHSVSKTHVTSVL